MALAFFSKVPWRPEAMRELETGKPVPEPGSAPHVLSTSHGPFRPLSSSLRPKNNTNLHPHAILQNEIAERR